MQSQNNAPEGKRILERGDLRNGVDWRGRVVRLPSDLGAKPSLSLGHFGGLALASELEIEASGQRTVVTSFLSLVTTSSSLQRQTRELDCTT